MDTPQKTSSSGCMKATNNNNRVSLFFICFPTFKSDAHARSECLFVFPLPGDDEEVDLPHAIPGAQFRPAGRQKIPAFGWNSPKRKIGLGRDYDTHVDCYCYGGKFIAYYCLKAIVANG